MKPIIAVISGDICHFRPGMLMIRLLVVGLLLAQSALADDVVVKVHGFLQGPFLQSSHLMRDDLNGKHLLPDLQPYGKGEAALGYDGTELLSDTVKAMKAEDAPVDWILLELHAANNAAHRLAAKAVILQCDGDMVDAVSGEEALVFSGVDAGDYYLVLRHRNHLGVMTARPLTLSKTVTEVDFSSLETPVYGENSRYEHDGVALLWAGDVNHNNRMVSAGPGNDASNILSNVLSNASNVSRNDNFTLPGYTNADLDLDGQAIFAGPGNDVNILVSNVLVHPGNKEHVSNYIVAGQIPAETPEEVSKHKPLAITNQ